jgi:hypothetical protein
MNDKTPQAPSTPGGTPIQDEVTSSPSREPASEAPALTTAARPMGPNASAIVVGLVAMVFAGLIIAKETMNLRVDWSRLGPGAIVGIGVVMVVIGAIGLIRRHDRV